MGKKTTDTLVREKQEQRILQISFWSGAGFVIAEFIIPDAGNTADTSRKSH